MPRKGEVKDISGMKFNRLFVVKLHEIKNRRTIWECKCDCGNTTYVDSAKIQSGHTKSCGCLNMETIKNLNYKTGLSQSKIYYSYKNMMNRCNRESDEMYYRYGSRGITVCEEWSKRDNGFETFLAWSLANGYDESLSLDRIDNEKGYSPSNCRWTDKYTQANNKSNNRFVKVNGEVGTVGNMARKHNVNYWSLLHRSNLYKEIEYNGLTIEGVKNGQ